jgi:septum formation protein
MTPRIILASTSPFRKQLLDKLGINFDTAAPDIDESRRQNESAEQLVRRLAEQKAQAVAAQFPDSLIIGSDQVACLGEQVLGKPGDPANALRQLQQASGQCVTFLTGLSLLNSATLRCQTVCEPFRVHFRSLSDQQINHYLQREQPFNCAGSFKSEALGIALFSRLEGDDPNSLIGLPLIRLIDMLAQESVQVI